jgi:predicted CoA-binding protein
MTGTSLLSVEAANHHVVVLGASPKPQRYSNQAIRLLQEGGYRITPVNPAIPVIEGLTVTHQLTDITEPVHTLTMYVGEARSSKMHDEILALKPDRVIFNPGSESGGLMTALEAQGAECIEGCTLVMLRTNQF